MVKLNKKLIKKDSLEFGSIIILSIIVFILLIPVIFLSVWTMTGQIFPDNLYIKEGVGNRFIIGALSCVVLGWIYYAYKRYIK